MTTRVHLADDHTMFRQGLESILSHKEGLEVVGSTPHRPRGRGPRRQEQTGRACHAAGHAAQDRRGYHLGPAKGIPGLQDRVLTLRDNLRYVQAISKMDVDAMMHKSSSAEDLLATVESVTRDGSNAVVVMPRALLQRLDNAPSGGLSEREIEVLVLAARGLSNRGIAEELHLAEATIKRHLANVYGKVGVRSRNEAVRKALLEDWIGLHEITSADGDVSSDEQAG